MLVFVESPGSSEFSSSGYGFSLIEASGGISRYGSTNREFSFSFSFFSISWIVVDSDSDKELEFKLRLDSSSVNLYRCLHSKIWNVIFRVGFCSRPLFPQVFYRGGSVPAAWSVFWAWEQRRVRCTSQSRWTLVSPQSSLSIWCLWCQSSVVD